MRLTTRFELGVFLLAGTLGSLSAQHPISVWAGEWGEFQRIQPAAGTQYEGAALSVTDCGGQHCTFTLQVKGRESHGDGSGDLHIESDREAVAHLKASGNSKCSLLLGKTGTTDPVITVKSQDEGCSDFCTPGASFVHSYPLHSRTTFFGSDIAACYAAPRPAQATLCASQTLSVQENQWIRLEWEVMNLGTPALDENAQQREILNVCDGASQPAACLADTFQKSTQKLNERKAKWQRNVTEAGNAQEAAQKIATIAGHYRRSFANDDVQGNTFQSTDKLWIAKASDHAIRYGLNLDFYNGHSCIRKGEASYKSGGMFVDQEQDASGKLCVFELVPTATGVQLADPTGICRMSDCGARGGYGSAFFSFTDRSHPKQSLKRAIRVALDRNESPQPKFSVNTRRPMIRDQHGTEPPRFTAPMGHNRGVVQGVISRPAMKEHGCIRNFLPGIGREPWRWWLQQRLGRPPLPRT